MVNYVSLKETKLLGNECFLSQNNEEKFPNLSEITEVDIERFFSNEMDELISELETLKNTLDSESQKGHLLEIISMCKKCKDLPDTQIIFDPFGGRLKFKKGNWVEG